jgi:lysozyme
MITSQKGIALISKSEATRLKAYKCPAGVWTIGIGHTPSYEGQVIDLNTAQKLLRSDLATAEKAVNNVKQPLNQNQFDALVSFVFNVGTGAFYSSTLKRIADIDSNDPRIKHEFSRWNKSKGRVLHGLTKRRKEESKLYFS